MRSRIVRVALSVAAIVVALGCGSVSSNGRSRVSDADFDKVELDTRTSNACSPEPDFETFRGIVIAMPKKVALGKLGRVPVCGAYVFTPEQYRVLPDVPEGLAFLVRDLESNESWSGHFVSNEIPPDPDDGPDVGDDGPAPAGTVLGGYFNVNLVPAWHAPRRPGKYRVVFTIDAWASAPVDFEVVK